MKKIMHFIKKHTFLLGALAVCVFLSTAAPSSTLASQLPEDYPFSQPYRIWGTISHFGDRVSITNVQGDITDTELILNISDQTRIVDAVDGFPVAAADLQDGQVVYAYVSQAMALSYPGQTHAEMIICGIPADFAAPSYETVKTLTALSDNGQNTDWQLTTMRGSTYQINSETVVLPFLTRNLVTAQDLTEGRTFLVWSDANGNASKIVMFPVGSSAPSGPASDPLLQLK